VQELSEEMDSVDVLNHYFT